MSHTFGKNLKDYVEKGGKVLMIDSERNTSSTVNELIEPFGLRINKEEVVRGNIDRWDANEEKGTVNVSSHTIDGGTAFATVDGKPIGVYTHYGKGCINVIGFGNLFNDDAMGNFYDVVPGEDLLRKFGLGFSLVRTIVEDNLPDL